MIKLNKDYSDYTDETDPNYPEGKAVNASTGDSVNGTPILASLVNNTIGSFQAMYKKAFGNTEGINGVEDNVNNSQFVDAVVRFTDDEIYNLGKCVLCTTEASNLNKVVLSEVVPRFSLKNGVVIKVIFQKGAKIETKSITTGAVVTLNYCNTGAKKIFARKDGKVIVLGNKVIGSDSVFFQELTDLNLIYLKDLDGGNGGWLIMGNPVLISNGSETSGFLYYADGTSVYNKQSVDNKVLKKATVSGIVNNSSQLIVNVRANNVVGSCVSSNYGSYALVSLPIRTDAGVYNFFVGQFKQIGTGYGLGGATDMEVTIDYWYY